MESLTVPATKFRNNFSEYLDEANKGKTIYIKKGKKIVVKMVSVEKSLTEEEKQEEDIVDKMFGMASFGLPRKVFIQIAEDEELSPFDV